MDFGYHMSTRGVTANPDNIAAVAKTCDQLGYRYFGVNDHVIVTTNIDSTYPYSPDGSWAGAKAGTCLETLTTLSFIAANTYDIRLLSSVLVIPHRGAVLTAKMLATVDVLSKGRLTVGAGAGWMREEMAALASPDYERRGTATREYVEAFRSLWTDPVSAYHGDFVDYDAVVCEPKPVQQPGPPIWFGGEGPAALRRAALYGDGWYPVGRNPRHPLDTVEKFNAAVGEVHHRAEAIGRDPADIHLSLYAPWSNLGREVKDDGRRLPFTGSADAIADDIGSFGTAGLQTLVLNLEGDSALAEATDKCEAFAQFID